MNSGKNIYKEDVDFSALALQDPDFAKVLKANGQLDFSDPESVQQLTKSLLKRDFKLQITLPSDRLCPPVPNRLNYLLWIQDLLDTSSESYSDSHDPKRQVVGLDIGTGASCIYPLLGCAQHPAWKFAATDIDDNSFHYARENVKINGLEKRIRLLKTSPGASLLPLPSLGLDTIDFTICNPPFYASTAELLTSASQKSRPPFTACTGAEVEMVTPGGEIAFVSRMIDESLVLRERVQWYTSMLGKYSSTEPLIAKLKTAGIGNYAVMEFVQGSKTRRWALGWSFTDLRPAMCVSRGVGTLQKGLLPFPSEYSFQIPSDSNAALTTSGNNLNTALSSISLKWMWKPAILTGVGFAARNVWSRAARRKTARSLEDEEMTDDDEEDEMEFGFKIQLLKVEEPTQAVQVKIRWLKGHDAVLFESFCGVVKRRLAS